LLREPCRVGRLWLQAADIVGLELGQGQVFDGRLRPGRDPGTVRRAGDFRPQPEIVVHDQLPVGGNQDIKFDAIDTDRACPLESGQGVLRGKPGGPAVADHKRFFRNVRSP
jgi:hypothetical protein